MGVPTQSSKGLRVATQCRDVEQFVRAFHRYCEDSGVFISHARRSVGEVIAFSFDLVDGSPALTGLGAVIEHFPTADNRFGRPGVVIALHRLTRSARRVFDDLTAARAAAPEYVDYDKTDVTPIPFAEARAMTANIQMLDPDNLTPIPQLPPRPLDVFPTMAKPPIAEEPDLPAPPPKMSRAATQSIAAIEIRPPARTPPAAIKIPTIAASTPVVSRTPTTQGPPVVSPTAFLARTPPTGESPPVVARTRTPVAAVPVVEPPREPVVARTRTPAAAVPVVEAPREPVVARTRTPAAAVPVVAEAPREPVVARTATPVAALPVVEAPREPVVPRKATPVAALPVVEAPRPPVVPASPIVEEPDSVVEDQETIPEPTMRMATPPHGALAVPELEASIVDRPPVFDPPASDPPAFEPSGSGALPLAPAPLELLGAPAASRVAEPTTPPATFRQPSIADMLADASGPAVAAHASEPLVAAPPVSRTEQMKVVFTRQPTRAPAATRWTKGRIWAVGGIAGAALLALGIVIGATFLGGARDSTRAPDVSTGSPTSSAPAPTPTSATAASPTAPTAPVAAPTASPTPAETSPTAAAATPTGSATPAEGSATASATPAEGSAAASPTPADATPPETPVATAKQPAHAVAKTPVPPKAPPKKPAHKHHSHTKPAGCTSLNCL